MAKIYVKQILAGKMFIPEVPAKWYDDVKAVFDDMLANEEITEEEYNKYMGEEVQG